TVGLGRTEVQLPLWSHRGETGQTPWSAPKPLLVDMQAAARELGYEPPVTWHSAVVEQVHWLVDATRNRDWKEVLPRGAQYLRFDYGAEDELVRELAG